MATSTASWTWTCCKAGCGCSTNKANWKYCGKCGAWSSWKWNPGGQEGQGPKEGKGRGHKKGAKQEKEQEPSWLQPLLDDMEANDEQEEAAEQQGGAARPTTKKQELVKAITQLEADIRTLQKVDGH